MAMASLAKRIEGARNRLKTVETKTVTPDGRELVEKRSKEGRFVGVQVGIRPWGFVGDFKPDLQVAEIIPDKLYMGSQDVAQDLPLLQSSGITHIVNIATGIENFFDSSFEYLKIEALDLPSSNLKRYFEDSSEFIRAAIENAGKVFVHCNAGISRSSTIVIAYLMKYEGKNFAEGLEILRKVRPCVRPNEGFEAQLKELEKELEQKIK